MPKKLTAEEFIKKAKAVHGDKYDYSRVVYVDAHTKVCIVCPIHGEFWQLPYQHLNGHGCKKCQYSSLRDRFMSDNFVEKAKAVHGDKYDYSKVEYSGNKNKVCIICPIHGEFWITPNQHLKGHGCKHCGISKRAKERSMTSEQFLERATTVHGDKYDYSKVKYVNSMTKVCIVCPIHGEFWQLPQSHLSGVGCPSCQSSKIEHEVLKILKESNIELIHHCSREVFPWLGRQHLDFYLPKYNIAIECQGIQHFMPIEFFGGEKHFEYVKEMDERKRTSCKENGLKLCYINYDENVETKLFELINLLC